MTEKDPLFRSIGDPVARKRALADNAGKVIDEIIRGKGVSFPDLQYQMNYLKKVLGEMKDL